MPDRLRFRGRNSFCRSKLRSIPAKTNFVDPKTARSKKGGFLLKILESSFRKIKTTIDNHKSLL